MKKFIAILSILLLINSSCETEKISSNNKELEQVQLAFTDDFATLIPFDFAVNWSTAKKGFSEELDADVTEFDVFWTGNYNPEDLYIARKNKEELTKNYRVTYKIIAAKEKNSYNFYAVKFTTYEGIEIESLSFLALNLLNGNINVYNNDSEEIISKSYVEGKLYLNLLPGKESATKRCEVETIYLTYNYYNLRDDGPDLNFSRTYSYSFLNCTDFATLTEDDYSGSSGGSSSGGSSGSSNSSTSGVSSSTPIIVDVILEDAPPPSCKSFDYSQDINGSTQTAAVNNVTFRVKYLNLNTGETMTSDVEFRQTIYFTIPRYHSVYGNLTNGDGANRTARALFAAHSRATAYFIATKASEAQVRAKLWEYIRDEMYNGSYLTGGAASFSPPLGYNGTTITEYKTTRLGMDNCN